MSFLRPRVSFMIRVISFFLVLLPLGAQWTPEEMMKVKSIGSVLVSPDGKRAIFTVTEPVMTEDKSEFLTQVWMARADGSGAFQFTFGDKSPTNPQWSPDGRSIAFTSGRSGKSNIWLIRTEGGEAEQISNVKRADRRFCPVLHRQPEPVSNRRLLRPGLGGPPLQYPRLLGLRKGIPLCEL